MQDRRKAKKKKQQEIKKKQSRAKQCTPRKAKRRRRISKRAWPMPFCFLHLLGVWGCINRSSTPSIPLDGLDVCHTRHLPCARCQLPLISRTLRCNPAQEALFYVQSAGSSRSSRVLPDQLVMAMPGLSRGHVQRLAAALTVQQQQQQQHQHQQHQQHQQQMMISKTPSLIPPSIHPTHPSRLCWWIAALGWLDCGLYWLAGLDWTGRRTASQPASLPACLQHAQHAWMTPPSLTNQSPPKIQPNEPKEPNPIQPNQPGQTSSLSTCSIHSSAHFPSSRFIRFHSFGKSHGCR